MDSLTQIVLGAAVAAVFVPPEHRRAALLAGAALGTLPDLDVIAINAFTDDPVERMVRHRGFSHSLLVLPVLGAMLWAWLRTRGGRVAEAAGPWFWAIQLVLITHPLLDACTVYGTQLLWPLPVRPVMWSSIFIIDPLYTVWLLLACLLAWRWHEDAAARRALIAGLLLSSLYLGFSFYAKWQVERVAERTLTRMQLGDAPRFSVPMPFNTLLWRVVAMTPDGYVEGDRSLVADRGDMRFQRYPSDTINLQLLRSHPPVRRLQWFNHGFMKAEQRDGQLVISDLRMGAEPDYSFRFVVARQVRGRWQPVPPEQLDWPWDAATRLRAMWERIWMPQSEVVTPP